MLHTLLRCIQTASWLQVLKEELQGAPFASGLFDQNMVAYLMKRYPANIMPHVYAANLDFRINENWIDYVGYNFSQLHTEADTILVSHFSGCSMCAAKDHNENLTLCESEFQRTFEFANCTYGNMGQNTDAVYTKEVHAMLSQLPFCRHKPTPEQCLQYMDADQFGVDQAATQASHHRHVLSQMPELYSQDRSSPQLFEQASETLPVFTYRRLLGQHPSAHNSE